MNLKNSSPFPNAKYEWIMLEADYRKMKITNDSGEGLMTFYDVLPGISVIYNDFHMDSCESGFQPNQSILCIDHCREGRLEQETEQGTYTFFQAGDLKVDHRLHHIGTIKMPTKHFHGVSIVFDLEQASESLSMAMRNFPINLTSIREKYCDDKHPFLIRGESSVKHIFSELYNIPLKIKKIYLQVKIFELLLFLDALELSSENKRERPYFYKGQIEVIKSIHALLTEDITEHHTLEALSTRFQIPLTTMKNCFKSVYGNSIFAYMRIYRMNVAATLLRNQQELSIAEIAGMVGYDSPGKFSAAFKDVLGDTPLSYRKVSFNPAVAGTHHEI